MQFVPITTSDVSLSARRAWIEMPKIHPGTSTDHVALRKESVDRNIFRDAGGTESICRSPQGERG